ncbi:methyltransferase family protein [Knoellia remsis]|uniref:Methyltransferase family protein n=1 Tax=Knoellia remsis TaxID=407159 RepID=A0A2T0UZC2_9MICO|nr:class I SAM-dependent methyltransferase [Knoellia remsis]PRY63280.1 methyltransferase family protein [Knoellia remsis]
MSRGSRQSRTDVAATYDVVADDYADHFPSTEPEQPADIAMIDRFTALVGPGGAVLDAGCGAGRMLPVLACAGVRPVGADLAPGMVRRARTDHPEFDVQVASNDALPFSDNAFDGVFAWYSTIHTPDGVLPTMLHELGRVLRPGGVLLVAFQTGVGMQDAGRAYRALGYDVELVRHLRTADVMSRWLAQAGIREVARLDREAAGDERDGQAVLIGRHTGETPVASPA